MNTYQAIRASAWAGFVAAQLGMANHPGTTRDPPLRRSRTDICEEADRFLEEYDRRFPETDHG